MTDPKIPKIPPKPGKDTVYIDVDDEITAIIEKVESAKEKVVALVLPKRAAVLQSLVNMRLLKRSAEKAAKNVVLITGEEILLPLAGVVGLHVASNLQSKPEIPAPPAIAAAKAAPNHVPEDDIVDTGEEEPSTKLDYHRAVGELAASHAADDDESIDLADEDEEEDKPKDKKAKAPKSKGPKVPNFDRFRLLVFGGGLLLVALIVFIILAIFVLPKATITIQTESIPVSANLTLTAADSVKTLDEAGNAIPAILESKNETSTQQVTATGQQNNGTKASGSITMTDCVTGLSLPSSVPAGTGVSADGLTYITQSTTTFSHSGSPDPANGCYDYQATSSTSISAQVGGTKYNVSSANFSVNGRSDVSASGSASGGTDSVITVVSQGDLDTAKNGITSADSAAFTKTFENALASQGLYVLTSTLKAGDAAQTANPALGAQATTTTVTTQITYTVLVVKKSDLTAIITDALTKQINKSSQRLSSSNVVNDATISVQNQNSPSNATLSVAENTTAVPILNVANIKKQATGQKVGDIKSAISGITGVKSVNVDLSPFWVSKAPKVSKITVVQKQVAGSGS